MFITHEVVKISECKHKNRQRRVDLKVIISLTSRVKTDSSKLFSNKKSSPHLCVCFFYTKNIFDTFFVKIYKIV